MDFQTALRSEHAVADVTAERFLTRVDFHMRIKSAFNREALVAVIALVWPFTRVRTNMPDEIARLPEGFRAVLAFVHIFLRLFPLRVFLNDQTPFDTSIKNMKIKAKVENTCVLTSTWPMFFLSATAAINTFSDTDESGFIRTSNVVMDERWELEEIVSFSFGSTRTTLKTPLCILL